MMQKKSGSRTLLMSVILSAPGPLVVGLGLIAGRSSTQIADFFRRSAELLAIIVAYIVYLKTTRNGGVDDSLKARMEKRANLFVGTMMCFSGAAMLVFAIFGGNTDKGNVIGGLIIAALGAVANTIFWIRYTVLSKNGESAILTVQSRLYRAKSLVDICVTGVLIAVMRMPGTDVARWLDVAGSAAVSLYLIWCGARTLQENIRENAKAK